MQWKLKLFVLLFINGIWCLRFITMTSLDKYLPRIKAIIIASLEKVKVTLILVSQGCVDTNPKKRSLKSIPFTTAVNWYEHTMDPIHDETPISWLSKIKIQDRFASKAPGFFCSNALLMLFATIFSVLLILRLRWQGIIVFYLFKL